jgi:hypothetical protein
MLNTVLWDSNIFHSIKLLIYKSMVKIILTYGTETWSIKWKHKHKLLATEMDYLRRSAGYYEWIELEIKQLEQKW